MNIQAQRLEIACKSITKKDVDPYCLLRSWLTDPSKRNDFEKRFKHYYGLNAGGMTDKWKEEYFKRLFSIDIAVTTDPYTPVLMHLYTYKRRKGDQVLAFSFVSKLVAIHDESQPLYDKHVSAFLGITPPKTGTNDFKIAGFLQNLRIIRSTYAQWSDHQDFVDVLTTFRAKFRQVSQCHNGRLFDFLVWAVGHYKIG
jgi:hypothetical protein